MKLRISIALVSSLFFTTFAPAYPVSIYGTTCSKLNATKTVSNIKFTCVKAGKKLVWNKGMVVKVKAPPAPIPSQSASAPPDLPGNPVATTTNSYLASVYKNLDLISTDLHKNTRYTNTRSEVYFEDSLDPWNTEIQKSIEKSSDRWRTLSPDFTNPIIVVATTKEWLKKISDEKCVRLYEGTIWGFAGAACEKYIGFYSPGAKAQWSRESKLIAPAHEAFHNAQFNRSHYKNWDWVPNWFQEGSASTAGTISAAIDSSGKYENFVGLDNYTRKDCEKVLEQWEANQNLTRQEIDHNLTNHCEYGLGRMMVEYLLYIRPNLAGLLNVYSDNANGITFSDSLAKNFGVSLPDFYIRFRKYLSDLKW